MKRISLMAALVLANIVVCAVLAEEIDNSAYRVRRVYAPDEQILKINPKDYLPMPRLEFERLIKSITSGVPVSLYRGAVIKSVRLSAVLQGAELRDGTAEIQIQKDSENPAEISLRSMNLPLYQPQWLSSDKEPRLGRSNHQQTELLVHETGTLQFQWSLKGTPARNQGVTFDLELPDAAICSINIRTDNDTQLESGVGVIRRTKSGDAIDWQVELGGENHCQLRFTPTERDELADVFANQISTYRMSTMGLEVTSTINLASTSPLSRNLLFELDAGLEPISIRVNDEAVNWVTSTSNETTLLAVDLLQLQQDPDAALPVKATVRVTSYARNRLGVVWQLPQVRARARWSQKKSYITLSEPLSLERLDLSGCHEIAAGVSSDAAERTIAIQTYDPETHSVRVIVDVAPSAFDVLTGNNLEISEFSASASVRIRLSEHRGSVFRLRARVRDEWEIENLEVAPFSQVTSVLDEWELVRDGSESFLEIKLNRPLTPDLPISLLLTAKRKITARESFQVKELLPVEFPDATTQRHLLRVRVQEALQLSWQNLQLSQWYKKSELPEDEADYVDMTENDVAMLLNDHANDVTLRFSDSGPQYSYGAVIRAVADAESLDLEFEITIDLEFGVLASIPLVTDAHAEGMQWYLQEEAAADRAIASTVRSSNGRLEWQLPIPESNESEIKIIGRKSIPLGERNAIPFFDLPNAQIKSATMLISSARGVPITVDHDERFEPLPANANESQLRFACSSFSTFLNKPDSFSISVHSGENRDLLTVWKQENETADIAGVIRHRLRLFIENHGASVFHMSIPAGYSIDTIMVNQEPMAVELVEFENLNIPIPNDQRYSVVTISFRGVKPTQSFLKDSITLPDIGIDIPVFCHTWTVWAPAGSKILPMNGDQVSSFALPSFLGRLFGRIVRNNDVEPFNLFSDQSWFTIVSGFGHADTQRGIQRLLHSLEDLAIRPNSPVTWDDVLSEFQSRNRIAKTRNYVRLELDQKRLQSRGISASTVYSLPPNRDALTHYDLGIIAFDGRLVLTTIDMFAILSNQLTITENPRVAFFRKNTDIGSNSSRSFAKIVGSLVDVDDWRKTRGLAKWSLHVPDHFIRAYSGWSQIQLDPHFDGKSVDIYDNTRIFQMATIAFLLAVAFCWWIATNGIKYAITTQSVAVAICFLVPAVFASIGTGVFWGAVVGNCFHWLRLGRSKSMQTKILPSNAPQLVSSIVFLLLLFSWKASPVEAADRNIVNDPEIHNVYIPSDQSGKATGSYVHVPRHLHDLLIQHGAILNGRSIKSLVRSAEYRLTLNNDQQNSVVIVAELNIAKLEFEREATIDWPKEALKYLSSEATVNQRPVQISKDPEAGLVSFPGPDREDYELHLQFNVPLSRDRGRISLSLPLPPIAMATLDLSTMGNVSDVEFLSRTGAIQRNAQAGRIATQLGHADELAISWPDDRLVFERQNAIQVYSWFQVGSNGVTAAVRAQWESAVDLPTEIHLIADGSMRLKENESDPPLSIDDRNANNDRRLRFLVNENKNSIDAVFDYAGISGFGDLRLPTFMIDGIEHTTFVAISVDERLDPQTIQEEGVTPIPVESFTAAMNNTNSRPPDYAYQIDPHVFQYVLRTQRLDDDYSTSNIENHCLLRLDQTDFISKVDVNPTKHGLLSCRIVFDKVVSVQRVNWSIGGDTFLADWNRSSPNSLMVYFGTPMQEPFSITIQGSVAKNATTYELPMLAVDDVKLDRERYVISSQRTITPKIVAQGFREKEFDEETLMTDWMGQGYIDSVWERTNESASIRVSANRDAAATSGVLLTTLRQQNDVWSYELEGHLGSQQKNPEGETARIKFVRFEVPQRWGAPQAEGGSVSVELSAAPQSSKQMVAVLPKHPQSDLRFILSGEISAGGILAPGNLVDVSVNPIQESNINRFLCLPTADEGFDWLVTGAERTNTVPQMPRSAVDGQFVFYRVTDTRCTVRMTRKIDSSKRARVERATHRVSRTQGGIQCLSSFKIYNEQSSRFEIELPPNSEVEQVSINSRLVAWDPNKELPLYGDTKPQKIQALWRFIKNPPPSDLNFHLRAPVLKTVDKNDSGETVGVDETNWHLMGNEFLNHPLLVYMPDGTRAMEVAATDSATSDDDDRLLIVHGGKHFRFHQHAKHIVVRKTSSWLDESVVRWTFAILTVVFGMILQSKIQQNPIHHFEMWAYAACVLFGLVWWLFLYPSLVGWVIIVITIVVALIARP